MSITRKYKSGDERYQVKNSSGKDAGYRTDILLQKLNVLEKQFLICTTCKGVMRMACIAENGETVCADCTNTDHATPNEHVRRIADALRCHCPMKKHGCKWSGTLKECKNHLDTCGVVRQLCRLGCGIKLPRNMFASHEEYCVERKVVCELCKMTIIFREKAVHKNECPNVTIACELNCGKNILRGDIQLHQRGDCSQAQDYCKLGCGVRLAREDLKFHERDRCENHIVKCEHCMIEVKFGQLPRHIAYCAMMKLPCELKCGKMISRENMLQHAEEECVQKELECPFAAYKCKVGLMKREKMNEHIKVYRTIHLQMQIDFLEIQTKEQSERLRNLEASNHHQIVPNPLLIEGGPNDF